jgi:limonene-1,2-epoxide hydrolase
VTGPPPSAAAVSDADAVVVGHFVSAFNQRAVDAMLARLDPQAEFHPLSLDGAEKEYRGHARVKEWFAQLTEFDHGHRIVVSEIEPSANGAILAVGRVEFDDSAAQAPFCGVYRLDDGLITEARHYLSDRATLVRLEVVTGQGTAERM